VDRLDTWLNAQRGWRRFGSLMLQVGPPCVLTSFACFGLFRARLPSHGLAFVGIIALGVVAAVMLGLLDTGRARKDGGKRAFRITWRNIAYTPVMMCPFLLILLTFNASPEWRQQHHGAAATALFVLVPGMFILTLERARYERRVRERRNYYAS
jgi:hypothetical protein